MKRTGCLLLLAALLGLWELHSVCARTPVPEPKGFCPPNDAPPGMVTTCDVQCKDCKETERCCPYGCRGMCREMIKEGPGFCPFDPKRCAAKPPHQCEEDKGCPDGQKCCLKDCKKQCVPALKGRSGYCPVPVTACKAVSGPSTDECSTDYHCTSPKKCCTVDCTQKCIDPKYE